MYTRKPYPGPPVLHSSNQNLQSCCYSYVPGISDHEAIYFHFNLGSLSYKNISHNIYLYHKGNIEGIKRSIIDFQQTFLSSNPYPNSVDQNWISFRNAVNQVVQDYIPRKQSRPPKHIPWLNKSIKTKMKKKTIIQSS